MAKEAPLSRRRTSLCALLLCLMTIVFFGCLGGCERSMEIELPGTWEDRSEEVVLYKSLEFGIDDELTAVFVGVDGPFEVPGTYDVICDGYPSAVIAVTFKATEELKKLFRELVAQLKAESPDNKDIAALPDELPETKFYKVHILKGFMLTLTDEEGREIQVECESKEAEAVPVDVDDDDFL